MRRREEFFNKKKSEASEAEKSESDKETSQPATFPCDQCDNVFKSEKVLKIHIGKGHKTVEKIRRSSSDPSLMVSPIRESGRIISCHNCGGDMSPTHLCQEEPVESVKCDWCEKVFNCEDQLENHKAAGCAKQYVCKACNIECLDYDGRWRHEIQFH